MAPENKRAIEMWRYISANVDFYDKRVLDLGCGYGDFLVRSLMYGAKFVMGIERDYIVASWADAKMQSNRYSIERYAVVVDDIERIVHDRDPDYTGFDIVLCFSVIPYLENRSTILHWIKENSDIAIIECQYNGDGPGLDYIKDDKDMKKWLTTTGWGHAEKIGWTDVMIRPAKRSIWKCYE